jgi:hypothetical protein
MIIALLSTILYAGAVLIFLSKALELHLAEMSYFGIIVTGSFIIFSIFQTILFIRSLNQLARVPPLAIDVREVAAVVAGSMGTALLVRLFSFSLLLLLLW